MTTFLSCIVSLDAEQQVDGPIRPNCVWKNTSYVSALTSSMPHGKSSHTKDRAVLWILSFITIHCYDSSRYVIILRLHVIIIAPRDYIGWMFCRKASIRFPHLIMNETGRPSHARPAYRLYIVRWPKAFDDKRRLFVGSYNRLQKQQYVKKRVEIWNCLKDALAHLLDVVGLHWWGLTTSDDHSISFFSADIFTAADISGIYLVGLLFDDWCSNVSFIISSRSAV